VNVTLNNGFAQTEVLQTFFNPNAQDLEAIYAFPVPKGASLSEVTIVTGEKTLHGEVRPKAEAETAYAEERQAGNDAGLATKNSFLTYEFRVAPVRANAEVQLRFVYYQPLEIDAGVGRYVYPLEDGGTDEVAKSFWTTHAKVEGSLAINVELKSAWPVDDVRVPGFEAAAVVRKLDPGTYRVSLDQPGASLTRDFVLYYRLADNLPGRIEVIPYRASKDKPGTFMMVVTPGVDLKPLVNGADYTYVLDVSGSMQGKVQTLASGVAQALGRMAPHDRFRVVTFNNTAREVLPWTSADAGACPASHRHREEHDPERRHEPLRRPRPRAQGTRRRSCASSVVLVTDGVANQGIVQPAAFHQLLQKVDVRVFGFLMGNSANWPLMRTIADASGGFYAGVSNADDIVGQILLAKGKVTHEALHHAAFKFSGPVRVFDATGDTPQKIYLGQQLVLFGRYEGAGKSTVTLRASLSGEDKVYTTTIDLPEIDHRPSRDRAPLGDVADRADRSARVGRPAACGGIARRDSRSRRRVSARHGPHRDDRARRRRPRPARDRARQPAACRRGAGRAIRPRRPARPPGARRSRPTRLHGPGRACEPSERWWWQRRRRPQRRLAPARVHRHPSDGGHRVRTVRHRRAQVIRPIPPPHRHDTTLSRSHAPAGRCRRRDPPAPRRGGGGPAVRSRRGGSGRTVATRDGAFHALRREPPRVGRRRVPRSRLGL
jgi:Ca-activated chloride channel family protein